MSGVTLRINYRWSLSLSLILFIALMLYLVKLFHKVPTYYTVDDMFGPLSIDSLLVIFACIMVLSIIVLSSRNNSFALSLIIALLPIFFKFLFPNILDTYYVTNYYDAVGHSARGAYVSITGHSDPNVDKYFDVQPGFFWWTSVFVNVIWGPQSSFHSFAFSTLVKHFNLIFLLLSIPILLSLFRMLKLSLSESFIAFCLFTLLSYSRFHYSAQAYTYLLYWIFLLLLFKGLSDRKLRSPLLITIFASLVFLHQGTTLYTLVAVFTLVLLSLYLKIRNRGSYMRSLISIFLTLLMMWLSYLIYMTIFTFNDFTIALKKVYESIIERGIEIVAISVERVYPLWQKVVMVKAIFFIAINLLSLAIILAFVIRKGKSNIYTPLLTLFSSTLLALSPIALSLGGAGYIERIYEILTPIISFSLTSLLRDHKLKGNIKLRTPLITSLIIFSILGYCIYFSGWNFQSVTYSEYKADEFVIENGPNIASTYSQLPIRSILSLDPQNKNLKSNQFYSIKLHDEIQFLYYKAGSIQIIKEFKENIINNTNILYASKTSLLAYKN